MSSNDTTPHKLLVPIVTALLAFALGILSSTAASARNAVSREDFQSLQDAVQEIKINVVSRPQMESYVRDHSPYAIDKGRLEAVLTNVVSQVSKQQGTVEALQKDVDAFRQSQATTNTKLDLVLAELRRPGSASAHP